VEVKPNNVLQTTVRLVVEKVSSMLGMGDRELDPALAAARQKW